MRIALKKGILEDYMRTNDLSVYDLAKKLGVASTSVYRILNGSRGLGNDMIAKIMVALNLTEKDFEKIFILEAGLPKGIKTNQRSKQEAIE